MEKIPRQVGPYKDLLKILSENTLPNWCHDFNTTNWDYLLQREISGLEISTKPKWLLSSHVSHLNGSVENWGNTCNRSEILLESDSANKRIWSLEANTALNVLIHQRVVIVAGISFKCATDRRFLDVLNSVSDELPIGESTWIIINSDLQELNDLKILLNKKLPNCRIVPVHQGFREWVTLGCLELKGQCILE
jgi:hypothetical protein